ncbi:MAG: polyprenol monophosphomannose synthase [Thermoanaerobaculia bacterium]
MSTPLDARVGVVVPTYKESENIVALVDEVAAVLPGVEIVVVDDSPDDATAAAVRNAGRDRVRIVHRDAKSGRGSAVLLGIGMLLESGCEQIAEMDADFSHPPSQLPELLATARSKGTDLLIASRYLPSSRIDNWPRSRRLFSRTANFVARNLLGVPVRDYTNGYRMYSRRGATLITETCGRLGRGFIPLSEILVNLHFRGYAIAEVPTHFVNRLRGESSVNAREIADALSGLWKIFLLRRRLQKKVA